MSFWCWDQPPLLSALPQPLELVEKLKMISVGGLGYQAPVLVY